MRLGEGGIETVRVKDVSCGNLKTYNDMELLVDDYIHEKDEWKERVQAKR